MLTGIFFFVFVFLDLFIVVVIIARRKIPVNNESSVSVQKRSLAETDGGNHIVVREATVEITPCLLPCLQHRWPSQ
jgi:hypothetical protein